MSKVKYHYDLEQGSDEWLTARLGIVTASQINSLVTPTGKLASGKAVMAYACEIASQRVNMCIEETYQSFDMMRGHFQEEIARDIYSENYETAEECGFIIRDFGEFKIGCSPDGLVGDDGGTEIKSRLAKFQVATIVANEVPAEYINQIQSFLLVSGRKWCDFVQYSNGMPLFVKRVLPDAARQKTIQEAVGQFEYDVISAQMVYESAAHAMIQTERVEIITDDFALTTEGEG